MSEHTIVVSTTVDMVQTGSGDQVRTWLNGTDLGVADLEAALDALPAALRALAGQPPSAGACPECSCPLPDGQDCAQCQAAAQSLIHSTVTVFDDLHGTWLQLAGELFGPYRTANAACDAVPDALRHLAFAE